MLWYLFRSSVPVVTFVNSTKVYLVCIQSPDLDQDSGSDDSTILDQMIQHLTF